VVPLINVLKVEDGAIRRRAIDALGKIGDPQAVEALIAALKDKDNAVRQGAALVLGQIRDDRAALPLIATLKDIHYPVRKEAAQALGELGDSRAVEPLILLLGDVDWVCQAAVKALVKIGKPAVEALITALQDNHDAIRWNAAQVLGLSGDTSAAAPLMMALKDSSPHVRKAAATALGSLGDSKAMESLVAGLRDEHKDVRKCCADTLDKLGWQPGQDIDGAYYQAGKEAWQACARIGAAAVEPLLAALQDRHWEVRQHAAEALGMIKGFRAIEALIIALDDQVKHVRVNAARALTTLYQAGQLNDQARQQILNQREKICQPHIDNHHECGGHTDRGIGVDFPL
jgi:HEAT repeat protein